MSIYTYKNEEWAEACVQSKQNGEWKQSDVFVYKDGFWKRTIIPIPDGLIVPYYGTTAPAGWSLFTEANGKFIVGAGGTYAVKSSGGATPSITLQSTSNGAHTGPLVFCAAWYSYPYRGENSAGSHSHTISFNYTPPYYGLSLIKSVSNNKVLPPKTIMFADKAMPGLTRFTNGDGMMFVADSSIRSGGSNTINAITSTNNGTHAHGSLNSDYYDDTGDQHSVRSAGGHSHSTASFTISPNLKRVLLSAWTNISKSFALKPGMYGFYEGTVPPEGWALCDGTNDTLDLRDYFIEFADEENQGIKTGDGTINIPNISLTSNSWEHRHLSWGSGISGGAYTYHDPYYNATHSHSVPSSAKTVLPPYYALSIITFKG